MMKKKAFYHFLMGVCLLGGLSFASCSDDDGVKTDTEDTDSPDVSDVVATVKDSTVYTAEQFAEILFPSTGSNDEDEELVSKRAECRSKFLEKMRQDEEQMSSKLGRNGLFTEIIKMNYCYQSVDQNNNKITLSGSVFWERFNYIFGFVDRDPDNMFLVGHNVITSKYTAPSVGKSYAEEIAINFGDNLAIIPDFMGFGESDDKYHPYLNNELGAQQVFDGLRAGYYIWKYRSGNGNQKMENNWYLGVVGASEGGAIALGVHKYFDAHPELAKEWRFAGSSTAIAPYSPVITVEEEIKDKDAALAHPITLPMTIKSMVKSYPSIMGKWTEKDFYSDSYKKVSDQVDEMLAKQETGFYSASSKMKTICGKESLTPADILNEDVFDRNSEKSKALFECLAKSDMTTGWTPTHKIKIYYSKEDELYSYKNAEAVKKAFGDMVEMSESTWFDNDHLASTEKWYLQNKWKLY